MTTTATGLLCWRDLHPLERQLASLHQHSLPSGRYALLGPDFHRLDRTSLRLAHLFDHLIGADEYRFGNRNVQRLGGSQIHDDVEYRRLFHR